MSLLVNKLFLRYLVPRVFRLLAEMEKGGSGFYTYGLEKGI